MKLKELAEIKQGLIIDSNLLLNEKKTVGIYVQCLQAKDFIDGKSHYIYEKQLKKLRDFTPRSFLLYGDYIIYKKENDFKLYRYEGTSGQTVAGNGLILLRLGMGILKNYLDLGKNRKHFLNELKKIETEESKITIENIGKIEIGVFDILELDEANIAEKIGIQKPIDISSHPISVTQKPLPADKLLKRIDNSELLLDTEFQRRPDLWTIETMSRLIESMLIDLPIPAFYFDGSDDDKWIVIDGLQRLGAMHNFVNGKFSLAGLDYLPSLTDKTFNDLDRKYQRKIEEYEVIAYIIGKETLPSVKFKIFKTINTSALTLNRQEIRHAISPGAPALLLKKIAGMNWFNQRLNLTPTQKDRMQDREVALRFIAFKRKNYSEYTPEITDFLDSAMTDIYEIPAYNQEELIKELESIFNIIHEILGVNAFSRSLFDDSRGYPHNNIMFEMITYGISIIPNSKRNKVIENKVNCKEKIVAYFEKKLEGFWDTETAYTKEKLIKRFQEIEVLFKTIV